MKDLKVNDNLHSNMFLLFHIHRNTRIFHIIIYIPICFYYFPTRKKNGFCTQSHLHSNMFLLFRLLVLNCLVRLFIYIPICFYYFFLSHLQFLQVMSIYIPICFYYFHSVCSLYQSVCPNLHSNMFLLFHV